MNISVVRDASLVRQGWIVSFLVGLLTLVVLGLQHIEDIPPRPRPSDQIGDAALQRQTVARLAAGEPYYTAVGDELRRNGYPTRPVFNWRTPLYYRTIAWLGWNGAAHVMRGLALCTVILAIWACAKRSAGAPIAAFYFIGGAINAHLIMPSVFVMFPEAWAGVLIGVSLALYYREQWVLAALVGVLAVFTRELAAPYVLVCGVVALLARRRRESVVWLIGGIAYVVYYVVHASQAIQHMRPTDLVTAESWVQFQGWSFVLRTLHHGWLVFLPAWATAVAGPVGLLALWSPSMPVQAKGALIAYIVFFAVAGQSFDFYWGLIAVCVWGYAFVHAADGLHAMRKTWTRHSLALENAVSCGPPGPDAQTPSAGSLPDGSLCYGPPHKN